jgi:hypothetical protein
MPDSDRLPFSARRRLHLLILVFLAITIGAGVAPGNRMEWWEGNIPIIAMLVILELLIQTPPSKARLRAKASGSSGVRSVRCKIFFRHRDLTLFVGIRIFQRRQPPR